jgi:plasmid replication initiation protein
MIDGKKTRELQEYYVVKSNDLIQRARYSLTVQQQKLILFAISKIRRGDAPDKVYELSIDECCSVMGLELDAGGTYYKRIKDDLVKLTTRLWVRFQERESTVSWISDAEIIPLSGTVYIKFHEKMTPYLFDLVNKYTQYQLYEVLVLKGKYSLRLYELLRSYIMQDELTEQKEKEVSFSVDELRGLLCCENYRRWAEFDRCVIRKAVDEINKMSDIIKVSYDTYKRGKAITRINFIINYPNLAEKFAAHNEQRKRM